MRTGIFSIAALLVTGSACAQAPDDQTFSGELTTQAPRAAFDLPLEEGQIVTLTTASRDHLDTVLALMGPDGRMLAENDDSGPGTLTSQLVFTAPADGRYQAIVSGYGDATGGFTLQLIQGVDFGLSAAATVLRQENVTLDQAQTEAAFDADLAEGDILVASTFALTKDLDTTLALMTADGEILAQNDDRGDGTLNSQIVFQAAEAGRYQLVVSSYEAASSGDLVLSLALDPDAEIPFDFTSIEGDVLATHQGVIDNAQPAHEFPLELAAGQTLLALGDGISGDLDVVLRLLGPDGFPVAMNDDRGDGSLNSAIAYTAPAAGTYTVVLGRYRGGESSGDFTLLLSSVTPDVVDTLQGLMENVVNLSGEELTLETPDFRVHYTLEGVDASSDEYARLVGEALQEVLEAQVGRIGWAEPLRDDDGRYRAYIGEADGNMGYTKPVQIVFDNPNTANVRETAAARTVFVIDNDFVGMGKTAPIESLMRATVTHEFNHVVQFGYDSEEVLDWLYEATASWTETTTVGSDQDATDYTEADFDTPQLCWTTTEAGHDYGQWTLLQSLADSYGEGFVVRIWEASVELDGFDTLAQPLAGVGTTIPAAIERWRAQNFALAYDLAPLFPSPVRIHHTLASDGLWISKGGPEQLGANYIALELKGRYEFALGGDAGLELVGLGQRNGAIEIVPLGRDGVFDTGGYEYAALMVFNRTIPEAPGVCGGVGYTITTTASTAAPAPASYSFDAANFRAPS